MKKTKKVTQPLGTKKSRILLGQKKSRNLLVQKKITQPLGEKCPKNSILVTNKFQEIGTEIPSLAQSTLV